jgi:hypothetical protein
MRIIIRFKLHALSSGKVPQVPAGYEDIWFFEVVGALGSNEYCPHCCRELNDGSSAHIY